MTPGGVEREVAQLRFMHCPPVRRLAVALQVSADVSIFGADERGPDGDLRLQFEAIAKFAPEEKQVIKALLEGMILKHEAKRWSSAA